MTFTRAELYQAVRPQISDEQSLRFVDADFDKYASAGQREIVRRHPEAMTTGDSISVEDPVVVSASVNPGIDAAWLPALMHYVAASVFDEDSEDDNNLRLAKHHWDAFERLAPL